jgi:hypothetical protein
MALVESDYLNAQSVSAILQQIQNPFLLNSFIQKNTTYEGGYEVLFSNKDTSSFCKKLYLLDSGKIFIHQARGYKILKKEIDTFCRFSYIFLDGNKYTKQQADSARKDILQLYQLGYSFTKLAELYNMDGNKKGELDWHKQNTMVSTVVDANKQHKVGEVYNVDTPEMNWYHLINKTNDAALITRVEVIWLQKK